jgi:hypothetical protein
VSCGIAAGVFYLAEVQSELIISCMTTVAVRVQPFRFCEIKLRTGEIQWVGYNFIHVYAIASHGGSGVASMKEPNFVKLEPVVVVEAIEDFLNIRTPRDRAKINFARERGFLGEEWKVDDFLAERRLLATWLCASKRRSGRRWST